MPPFFDARIVTIFIVSPEAAATATAPAASSIRGNSGWAGSWNNNWPATISWSPSPCRPKCGSSFAPTNGWPMAPSLPPHPKPCGPWQQNPASAPAIWPGSSVYSTPGDDSCSIIPTFIMWYLAAFWTAPPASGIQPLRDSIFLSTLVRAKFRDRMAKAGVLEQIPAQVWDKGWNVNCQAVGSPEASIKYLTPYVFRVAIANSRIVKVENGRVFFRWCHQQSHRLRVIDLDALEFIRRFLQHVLPAGFMKVRYYGCMNPNFRMSRRKLQCRVEMAFGFSTPAPVAEQSPSIPPVICEQCGSTMVWHCSILPYRGRVMASQSTG